MSGPFWPYARRMLRYRWQVALALLFATLSAGGLGAGLLGIKPVVDNLLSDKPRGLSVMATELNASMPAWLPKIPQVWIDGLPTDPFTAMLWIVLALGALTIVGATFNFLHAYIALTIISRTVANLRREAFSRVVHLPLKTVLKAGPSDLISRIVYDTSQLGSGFNALLSRAVAQITKGLAAGAAGLFFDWRVAIGALVAAPVLAVILRKLGKRIRRASRKALEAQAGLYRAASEVLGGLRVVKVHTTETAECGRFHKINKDVVSQEFKVRTARALASPLIETIAIVVLGALALIAVKAILDGALDKTNALLALGSLSMAAAQLKPLTGLLNDIQQASAAGKRMSELMDMDPEPGHATGGQPKLPKLARPAQSIEFRDVALTYAGADKPALGGITLLVPHGRTYAFVGPNGCGKTTLLSLIPRLFDPDYGQVLIDGRDIREVSVRSLREHISVVTQETVLFSASIRDNIAYGATSVTEADIRGAAKRARAEEFILAKPGGYDFVVGEQGSGLSGGQRQRIAIARAILRDPAILILDEATSMIDAESEAKIAEAVADFVSGSTASSASSEARARARAPATNGPSTSPAPESKHARTCLIVAHRLSTVIAADAIVVMAPSDAGGIIADIGTHDELLKRCEIYKSLVNNQLFRKPPN